MIEKVQVIVHREPDGRVLLLRRPPARGRVWQTVTGKVHADESHRLAARRELAEETGILAPRRLFRLGFTFEFKTARGTAREEVFVATVPRGTSVLLSEEHEAYRWVRPDVAIGLVAHEGVRTALGFFKELLDDLCVWDD